MKVTNGKDVARLLVDEYLNCHPTGHKKFMESMAKEQQELEQESFEEQFLEKTNDEKKKYEEAIEESWLEKLEKLKEDGWLNFVLPFDQAASGYVIEAEDLPSKWRTVNFTWYHSAISEMEESFLFTEYLLEHCHSFTCTGETN